MAYGKPTPFRTLSLAFLTLGISTAGWTATGDPAANASQAQSQAKKPRAELKVNLFGQPCLLQGPTDEPTLSSIHAVSPEQTYTVLSMEDVRKDSIQQLKQNLEKLKKTKPLPQALERYRDRLSRRLDAQVAFLEGLQAAQAAKKSAPLLTGVQRHLQGKPAKAFEAAAKKLDRSAATESAVPALQDQLYELYSDLIEPDPEEEFHRGIQKLNVQYVCAFDERNPDEDEDSPEAE